MVLSDVERPAVYRNILDDIARVSMQFEMLRLLRNVSDLFGMRAFIIFKLPESTDLTLQASTMISNWPAQMLAQFDMQQLLRDSTVIEQLRHSAVPFSFDFEEQASGKVNACRERSRDLFAANEMLRNTMLPVCDPVGLRGGVCFSGNRPLPTDDEMLVLHMIATHAFDRLYQISRKDARPDEELTEREIDCLTWTAAGKTSAEIADILGLSEHTVNHYLNRAARKLDTVNRTQAVARAIRAGIIR